MKGKGKEIYIVIVYIIFNINVWWIYSIQYLILKYSLGYIVVNIE